MKAIILLLALTFLSMQSNAQLVDVIVESMVYLQRWNIREGFTTYRVYARLQEPTDFLSAVYGIGAAPLDPDHTLMLGSIPNHPVITQFWNSAFGGVTGPSTTAFCAIFAETCYDSFFDRG